MSNLLQQGAQPPENSITYIYGLVDPITEYVRYIGKSDTPKLRLKGHLTKQQLRPKSHKVYWIKGLLDAGEKPQIIILAKVEKSGWQVAERKWIAYYRSIPGYPPLTNGTSGGDGIDKGTKFSEETRKQMSASRMGMKMSPEAIAKRVAARKGIPFSEQHRKNLSEATKNTWENFTDKDKEKRLANLRHHGKTRSNCTSKFLGVTLAQGKYWRAYVTVEGKTKYIGNFKSEVEAAIAHDARAIELIGAEAILNFVRSDYE